jgi:hypothetical protein
MHQADFEISISGQQTADCGSLGREFLAYIREAVQSPSLIAMSVAEFYCRESTL